MLLAESREERRLIRQRGAGTRELKGVDFGFSFAAFGPSRSCPRGAQPPRKAPSPRALDAAHDPEEVPATGSARKPTKKALKARTIPFDQSQKSDRTHKQVLSSASVDNEDDQCVSVVAPLVRRSNTRDAAELPKVGSNARASPRGDGPEPAKKIVMKSAPRKDRSRAVIDEEECDELVPETLESTRVIHAKPRAKRIRAMDRADRPQVRHGGTRRTTSEKTPHDAVGPSDSAEQLRGHLDEDKENASSIFSKVQSPPQTKLGRPAKSRAADMPVNKPAKRDAKRRWEAERTTEGEALDANNDTAEFSAAGHADKKQTEEVRMKASLSVEPVVPSLREAQPQSRLPPSRGRKRLKMSSEAADLAPDFLKDKGDDDPVGPRGGQASARAQTERSDYAAQKQTPAIVEDAEQGKDESRPSRGPYVGVPPAEALPERLQAAQAASKHRKGRGKPLSTAEFPMFEMRKRSDDKDGKDEDPGDLAAILRRYGDPKIPANLMTSRESRLNFRF